MGPWKEAVPAAVVAIIASLLSTVGTYATLRTYAVLFIPESNPATVVWSVHIPMFWRLLVGGYVAGMIAPPAFFWARQNIVRAVVWVHVFAWIVAGITLVQGIALP